MQQPHAVGIAALVLDHVESTRMFRRHRSRHPAVHHFRPSLSWMFISCTRVTYICIYIYIYLYLYLYSLYTHQKRVKNKRCNVSKEPIGSSKPMGYQLRVRVRPPLTDVGAAFFRPFAPGAVIQLQWKPEKWPRHKSPKHPRSKSEPSS